MGIGLVALKLLAATRTGRLRKLDISVTHRCGMRCKTCSVWHGDDSEKKKLEMNPSDYVDFFKKNNKWKWIGFTGGEPFLRSDLEEIVEAAAGYCPDLLLVSVATNGSAPDRILNFASWFTKAYPRILLQLSVSLDGGELEHDRLRGRAGSFKSALRTFKLLQDSAGCSPMLRVTVSYTISTMNAGSLAKFSDVTGLKSEDIQVAPATISYRYMHTGREEIFPEPALLQRDLAWMNENLPRRLENLLQLLFLRACFSGRRVPCLAGRGSFHMEPDGGINPCVLINERIADHRVFDAETKFTPSRECRCFTPCETYPALLSAPKKLLAGLLFSSLKKHRFH